MYSSKKIPAPFSGTPRKNAPVPRTISTETPIQTKAEPVPIKTAEAETILRKKNSTASPLMALLFLELFSDTKKE